MNSHMITVSMAIILAVSAVRVPAQTRGVRGKQVPGVRGKPVQVTRGEPIRKGVSPKAKARLDRKLQEQLTQRSQTSSKEIKATQNRFKKTHARKLEGVQAQIATHKDYARFEQDFKKILSQKTTSSAQIDRQLNNLKTKYTGLFTHAAKRLKANERVVGPVARDMMKLSGPKITLTLADTGWSGEQETGSEAERPVEKQLFTLTPPFGYSDPKMTSDDEYGSVHYITDVDHTSGRLMVTGSALGALATFGGWASLGDYFTIAPGYRSMKVTVEADVDAGCKAWTCGGLSLAFGSIYGTSHSSAFASETLTCPYFSEMFADTDLYSQQAILFGSAEEESSNRQIYTETFDLKIAGEHAVGLELSMQNGAVLGFVVGWIDVNIREIRIELIP